MKVILSVLFSMSMVACGTDEPSYEPSKNALCKTLKDGTVDRREIDLKEESLRNTMAEMGYEACH